MYSLEYIVITNNNVIVFKYIINVYDGGSQLSQKVSESENVSDEKIVRQMFPVVCQFKFDF